MTSKSMTLKEMSRYLDGLPKALEKAAVKGIQVGAQRAIAVAVAAGDAAIPASANGSKGAFDTGEYRRSWKVENLQDGAILGNSSKQADIIERGRRPGRKMPPLAVIEQFAMRKLGLSATEAKMARFPIARAIARRGLRARRVLSGATSDIIKVVLDEVKSEISKALRGGVTV